MHRPLRCVFHTSPAPDGAGYLGSYEVVDRDGRRIDAGSAPSAYVRMQDALDGVWPLGRASLARLDDVA